MYCPDCSEKLAYDPYEGSWFCLECELILLLTNERLAAKLAYGRSRGVFPFPRALSVAEVRG
jgi:hypothetical protein